MPVVYLKPKENLTPAEQRCVDTLSAAGYHLAVLAEDPDSPANIDLFMEGKLWEMKNVGDGKHSVNDRIRDGYHKWERLGISKETVSLVISSFETKREERDIVSELKRRLQNVAKEIYITRNGKVIWIKE